MLDIKFIRENPDVVKAAMKSRNANMDAEIDEILRLDRVRRELTAKVEAMKSEQNAVTKKIPQMKKNGEDTSQVMREMKVLSDEISGLDGELSDVAKSLRDRLLAIPNIPNETVPMGVDDSDNVEVRRWGEPRDFGFSPKAHWDLGRDLNILDPKRAAKVTGARFHFYRGLGARLERAIINFFLDTHTSRGYTEILPPDIVNRAAMTGTGQLPKFEEDAFKLANDDYFLISTAEIPLTNYHREEILDGTALPIKYCAYSACFRAEAGSAGKDTRGLVRQHQFNKVEMVKFTRPDASYDELEKLTADAENVLQLLGLPYRVVCLSTGDLGFCAAKTYDVEVWMPSYDRYVEISSCSNCEDYQARRASIRFKDDKADKAKFVHTLNGSGLAVGRTVAAILENYQEADGSVTVPEVLRPYMNVSKIG